MSRFPNLALPSVAILALLAGCTEKKAADTGAAADTTMVTTPTPAPAPATMTPPAELKTQSDKLVSAWKGKDPAAVAAFFASDATASEDTLHFSGSADLTKRWIRPTLMTMSNLTISNQVFTGTGDTITETGNYSNTITQPKMAAVNGTGTYTVTWNKVGSDWKVKDFTVKSDKPAM